MSRTQLQLQLRLDEERRWKRQMQRSAKNALMMHAGPVEVRQKTPSPPTLQFPQR